jgi:D-alanyl-D-alanine dipeptidase
MILPLKRTAGVLVFSMLATAARADALPQGFVRLSGIAPSIVQDMRYAGYDNFTRSPVPGYQAASCILTEPAAKALARVQQRIEASGRTLVVHDCYRPRRAVASFVRWVGRGGGTDRKWYPETPRGDLISKGYIGRNSAHSRGSTVDVSIARREAPAGAGATGCGAKLPASLDFGTGFDCFDEKSRTASKAVPAEAQANRRLLVELMRNEGFRNYAGEWWHFTLANEPFPRQGFDFAVR